jgi:hypothetical protein
MSSHAVPLLGLRLRRVTDIKTTIAFSICSVVNDLNDYNGMVESFVAGGFTERDCEYLFVDNSGGNALDSFASYNQFLMEAEGRYIILCHQDVRLLDDDRATLEARLQELETEDRFWAVCGNAGTTVSGDMRVRISDKHGSDQRFGPFPARVVSLDENFIVAKREANLALSRDLFGFHFYGTDLCIIAEILGWNSYVVDFHLLHTGRGMMDADFFELRDAFEAKYSRVFRRRRVQTSASSVHVGVRKPWLFLNRIRRRLAGGIFGDRTRSAACEP